MDDTHHGFMKMALKEAEKAGQKGEVPIGAVLVAKNGENLVKAHNLTITLSDPMAHAEILAIRNYAKKLMNYRLLGTTLYVTMEPCIMCMGAIIHARVATVIFGAPDLKWGAAGSLYNFAEDHRLNHQPEIKGNVCVDECKLLVQDFFRRKRLLKKGTKTSV
jgi:tRNA(adenine34) deaminase